MKKFGSKISTVGIIFILITTVIASSGFALMNKDINMSSSYPSKVIDLSTTSNNKTPSEYNNDLSTIQMQTKKYVIFRFGPDGSIDPINIDLIVQDKNEIEKALMEKCSELVINDKEMQTFASKLQLDINITNISLWAHVQSWGTGEHWKSVFRFRIPLFVLLRFSLFQDVPLRYKMFGINVIPWLHCNYMDDENAETIITTLPVPIRENQTTSIIRGKHNVTSVFFFGYAFWKTSQALWFDDNGISTGFDGYAFLTWITKPPAEN